MNLLLFLALDFSLMMVVAVLGFLLFVVLGSIIFYATYFKKIPQGQALVRTGRGGIQVAFDNGMLVVPVLHIAERMDISLKKLEIQRLGKDGLICKDNLRADIKVVFFVRVNKTKEHVTQVAQTIGCARASSNDTLIDLFEAKFSEALKTAGKQFDFEELYNSRDKFKAQILQVIGEDLNGYNLDDCAIDYLEQTPLHFLKEDNILDAQGIKKITELTANEKIKANLIRRDEEKIIKKQDVDAREAILELDRQLAEKEAIQEREIATIRARETAETDKVGQEERLKAERARIAAEEEIQVAEENRMRQVIVAQKNKERTEAVETERVEKDRLLELNERERVVTLAQIEKEKAVEEEKRNIQDVIRERIVVEKAVVEEEEKIKDTRALAEADRAKTVAITNAQQLAESEMVKTVKKAEAEKEAAKVEAEKRVIDAQAEMNAAKVEAEAIKMLAEAKAVEEAAIGKSEAQVTEAKAIAAEREGIAQANIIEKRAVADAKAIELRAEADKKRGLAEAVVASQKGEANAKVIEQKALAEAKGLEQKALAEAKGFEQKALAEAKSIQEKGLAEAKSIEEKANAMKLLDGVGREHEEFKLQLDKEKEIELAAIDIERHIAEAQAMAMSEALKSTKIDIVGGETMFFDNIMSAISRGKAVDHTINNSKNLLELKGNLLNGGNGTDDNVIDKVRSYVRQLGLDTNDIKNLTLTAALIKMTNLTGDKGMKNTLNQLLNTVSGSPFANQTLDKLGF